jgi:hypothetical protein
VVAILLVCAVKVRFCALFLYMVGSAAGGDDPNAGGGAAADGARVLVDVATGDSPSPRLPPHLGNDLRAVDFPPKEVVEIRNYASVSYDEIDGLRMHEDFTLFYESSQKSATFLSGFVFSKKSESLGNVLVIAFHGTRGFAKDVWDDLNIFGNDGRYADIIRREAFNKMRTDYLGLEAHSGFAQAAIFLQNRGVDNSLISVLTKKFGILLEANEYNHTNGYHHIILTGHSMGGAKAQAYALLLCAAFNFNEDLCKRIKVFAFCSPKVFNDIAAALYQEFIGDKNSIHFYHRGDIVTGLPCRPFRCYVDVGTQQPIEGCCKNLRKMLVNSYYLPILPTLPALVIGYKLVNRFAPALPGAIGDAFLGHWTQIVDLLEKIPAFREELQLSKQTSPENVHTLLEKALRPVESSVQMIRHWYTRVRSLSEEIPFPEEARRFLSTCGTWSRAIFWYVLDFKVPFPICGCTLEVDPALAASYVFALGGFALRNHTLDNFRAIDIETVMHVINGRNLVVPEGPAEQVAQKVEDVTYVHLCNAKEEGLWARLSDRLWGEQRGGMFLGLVTIAEKGTNSWKGVESIRDCTPIWAAIVKFSKKGVNFGYFYSGKYIEKEGDYQNREVWQSKKYGIDNGFDRFEKKDSEWGKGGDIVSNSVYLHNTDGSPCEERRFDSTNRPTLHEILQYSIFRWKLGRAMTINDALLRMGELGEVKLNDDGKGAQERVPTFDGNGVFGYNTERFYEAYLHKLGVFYGSSHEQFIPSVRFSFSSCFVGASSALAFSYLIYNDSLFPLPSASFREKIVHQGTAKKIAYSGTLAVSSPVAYSILKGKWGRLCGNLVLTILDIYKELAAEVGEGGNNDLFKIKKKCLDNFAVFVRIVDEDIKTYEGDKYRYSDEAKFFAIKSRADFGKMFNEEAHEITAIQIVANMRSKGFFRHITPERLKGMVEDMYYSAPDVVRNTTTEADDTRGDGGIDGENDDGANNEAVGGENGGNGANGEGAGQGNLVQQNQGENGEGAGQGNLVQQNPGENGAGAGQGNLVQQNPGENGEGAGQGNPVQQNPGAFALPGGDQPAPGDTDRTGELPGQLGVADAAPGDGPADAPVAAMNVGQPAEQGGAPVALLQEASPEG